jgi:eukaryotic-like serine/threonine-protein kinase
MNGSASDSRERWQRIRAIFDETIALPEGQRMSRLEERCDTDTALLAELYSLVEASQSEEALSSEMSEKANIQENFAPKRRSIGPYELDNLLGRGGMGAVYLAHRADGQFRQQLAIKLIDLPLATELYRKQFRIERQILARLTHPFIARLLDGGVSENGELYLAMEYIDGISILTYCEQNHLSLRDRLLLFENVCNAVQYAHQNLVIHRDLKPDNILVVADGTPRLLDFGTAKLLSELPEEASDFTQHGLRSFTPQFASPEQVLGRPVSTASDVYSLGVLLFQILAGVPPYALKEFNTEEMLRVICTDPPSKPSTLSISAEPPDADLDAIVLKALRKEPEERYLTVDQFATDIKAWLVGLPVIARRGTLRYRAGKFVRRNKLALTAASLLLAAVGCGVAGVLWQSRVANLERIRAQANAQEMRELSNSFLSEINKAVTDLPGSTPVRRLMVQRVLEHLDRIPHDATEDRSSRLYLINAYIQLGSLQGNPYVQNIGDGPGALASLDKAVNLAQSLRSRYPNDRFVMKALAFALTTQSRILFGIGRAQEAVASAKAAIPLLDAESDSAGAMPDQIADAAVAHHLLGDELGEPEVASIGDYPNALKEYRTSYALYERALAIDPNYAEAKREIATSHLSVGCILALTVPARAIDEFRTSLSLWGAVPIADKSDNNTRRTILYDSVKLADALTQARDYRSAIATYDEAQQSLEVSAASDSRDSRAQGDFAGILGGKANLYIDMADPLLNPGGAELEHENLQIARRLLRQSIAVVDKLVVVDPNNQLWTAYLANEKALLGTVEQRLGGPDRGSQMADSGVATLRQLASASDASSDVLVRATSVMLTVLPVQLRDTSLTIRYAERLATISHHSDPTSLLLLAQAYRADGQFARSITTAQEGLNLLPPHLPGTPATRCRILLEHITSASAQTL